MQSAIESQDFNVRLRNAISLAWEIFIRKAGNGLLVINKEASMQLHYAYILQQVLPLVIFHRNETAIIELETGVSLHEGTKEVDLLLKGTSENGSHKIAVEMKCYKKYASSGNLRGATDIFMKDVYEDLRLLETYITSGIADKGVSLVMNDLERLVRPKNKNAKCWAYDISDGTTTKNVHLNTPIGGKDISIHLSREYNFYWQQHGPYWFIEIEGKA